MSSHRNSQVVRVLVILFVLVALLVFWVRRSGEPGERQDAVEGSVVADSAKMPVAEESGPDLAARVEPTGVTALRMEPFDAAAVAALHQPKSKGALLRFAEAREVKISPERDGVWGPGPELGTSEWHLRIDAPGAVNVNLGFGRYRLPESAALEMRDVEDGELFVRPFTALDNDDHGELWTPVVTGESLELVLTVADRERSMVALLLERVNLGFRPVAFAAGLNKIGGERPDGSCHIDVVCSAAQSGVGDAIDMYRDQIRSVGAFTLQGVDTCSGFMVNNTAEDRTPYVMTADHCGVRSFNAASLVVYWNFENSTCRTVGSTANGSAGNGPLNQFNSGAIFRATWSSSDFTLVEMDDPVDPSVNVHYAGWSRINTVPSMGVGIHHPSVTEKRISFDFDSLQSTSQYGNSVSVNGTHLRVIDWDFGTTEPGSSGSPLFDENGRVVGQLTGGDAACGNNLSDWYGKMSWNWTGGGASSSSLKQWLDPLETGAMTLDGVDGLEGFATITPSTVTETDSGTTTMQFVVELSNTVSQTVDLGFTTHNGTAEDGSDFIATTGTVTFLSGELSKVIEVMIVGDTSPEEHEEFTVELSVVGAQVVAFDEKLAVGRILNNDFITPVIVGPSSAVLSVAEQLSVTMEALHTPTTYSLIDAPDGMQISDEGVLTWVPSIGGVFNFSVVATNPADSVTAPFVVEVNDNLFLTALDIDLLPVIFGAGGDAEWISESTADLLEETSVGGDDRLMSGAIGHHKSTWFEVTVEGPDYVGFWWKVSSQPDFDMMTCEVDGDERFRISGEKDWSYGVVPVGPGSHVLRWTYSKNGSVSLGADAGWVDFVQLSSVCEPFLMEPPVLHVAQDSFIDWQIPTRSMASEFSAEGFPDGLTLGSDGVVLGTATVSGVTNFNLTMSEGETIVTVPAKLEVHEVIAIGDALDQPNLAWFKDGDGGTWVSQGANTHDDDDDAAWEVGVPDGGRGGFSTVMHGPGEVTFWWMVSSEQGRDFLRFELDGTLRAYISGSVGWTSKTMSFDYGPHVLTWTYVKDSSGSSNADTARVDQVTFSGYSGWISNYAVGSRTNGIFDNDHDGMSQFMEYAIGGNPLGWESVPVATLSGGALELTVNKPGEVPSAYYEAEVSGDLRDWENSGVSVLQDDAGIYRARDTKGTGTDEKRFMRFRAGPTR